MLIEIITGSKQERGVIFHGIPDGLVQTEAPESDKRTMMKIQWAVADMLLEIDS